MKVIEVQLNDLPVLEPSSACIGYFDGMHVGHMKLVSEMILEANNKGLKKALITFHPDPWVVLKNKENIPHITSMEERIEIGRSLNLDYWIIIPFTKELSQMSNIEFEMMLSKLNVQSLICGFDYSYGYKGSGNIHTLKQQTLFNVIEVESVKFDNEKISSTRIETVLNNGNVTEMIHLLGRYYSIKGEVITGRSLGKTIGFPTANIKCKFNSILPKPGVYIGYVNVNQKTYRSMINIGNNPTFNYQDQLSMEAHILDFNSDIYGKDIEVTFVDRLRDEMKFNSKEELISQLNLDIEKAKQLNLE